MKKGKIGSKLMALLLAAFMLVAYMPLLGEKAYADDSAISYTNIADKDHPCADMPNNYGVTIATDKKVYAPGEDIYVKVTGVSNMTGGSPWIGLFDNTAGNTSHYWAYLNGDTEGFIINNTEKNPELTKQKDITAPDDYYVIAVDNSGRWAGLHIIITENHSTFSIDKSRYKVDEPINVSATSDFPGAWVGFYEYADSDPLDEKRMSWYSLADNKSGEAVDVLHGDIVQDKDKVTDLPPGRYKVILFSEDFAIDETRGDGGLWIQSFYIEYTYTLSNWEWYEEAGEQGAYATFVANEDSTKSVEVDATVTSETVAPTCDAAGKTIYTATIDATAIEAAGIHFTEGEAPFTDTKEVASEAAIGHKYGEPTYTWSDDNSKCTAKMVCEHDATHVVEETVDAVKTETPATCEAAGKITYTATFKNESFKEQSKETAGEEATGHKYGEPTYTWSDDNSKCTVKMVCEHDATHVVEETVDAVKTVETAATCEAAGKVVYTATFENKAFEAQTKEAAIEATGHNWGEWKVTKEATETEEGIETRTCKNDSSHTETRAIPKKEPAPVEPTEEEKAAAEAKEALGKTVEDAKKIEQGNYTDESFKALQDAIADAEALAKDEKATKAQLDAAAAKINDAKAALKEKEPEEPAGPAKGTKVVKSGNTFKVATAPGAATSEVVFTKAKNAKKVTVPATIKIDNKVYKVTSIGASAFKGKKIRSVTIGKNVKKITANAFKSSKATSVIVKTKLLSKARVKGSLKGSKIKTVSVKIGTKKTNKKYVKKYKSYFTKKNAGRKVTVK